MSTGREKLGSAVTLMLTKPWHSTSSPQRHAARIQYIPTSAGSLQQHREHGTFSARGGRYHFEA